MTLTDAQENPARIMFCVSRDDLCIRVQRDNSTTSSARCCALQRRLHRIRQIDEGGRHVERLHRRSGSRSCSTALTLRDPPSSNRSPILFMNEERLPRRPLHLPDTYKRRRELMRERFEHMLDYANETRWAPCWKPTSAGRSRAVRRLRHLSGPPARRKTKSADAAGNAAESLRKEVLERLAQGPPTANWPTDFRAACSGPAK